MFRRINYKRGDENSGPRFFPRLFLDRRYLLSKYHLCFLEIFEHFGYYPTLGNCRVADGTGTTGICIYYRNFQFSVKLISNPKITHTRWVRVYQFRLGTRERERERDASSKSRALPSKFFIQGMPSFPEHNFHGGKSLQFVRISSQIIKSILSRENILIESSAVEWTTTIPKSFRFEYEILSIFEIYKMYRNIKIDK